jgi:hypothetical protein
MSDRHYGTIARTLFLLIPTVGLGCATHSHRTATPPESSSVVQPFEITPEGVWCAPLAAGLEATDELELRIERPRANFRTTVVLQMVRCPAVVQGLPTEPTTMFSADSFDPRRWVNALVCVRHSTESVVVVEAQVSWQKADGKRGKINESFTVPLVPQVEVVTKTGVRVIGSFRKVEGRSHTP